VLEEQTIKLAPMLELDMNGLNSKAVLLVELALLLVITFTACKFDPLGQLLYIV